ncbi:class F sortase [Solicola sp. PLA-1-18]|uniref:class F sortase n=1 Tax=Solicola sp. PLA-1-18 TaxID=3380532 RepID=UPI003BA0EF3B
MTAGVLAVLLAACGGPSGGVQVPDETSAPPTSEGPAPQAPVAPRAAGNVLPEVPTAVRLPDGRRVPVAPAPTDDTGRLAVPDDPDVAGWWDGGARPGDPFGATVVAAHVDSVERGLGPFASLLSARRGERVTVTSAGLTTTYRVSSLRTIPKERLRTDGSVFAGDGDPRLVLVTCAGPYERARGGYQNLLVLTAVPVGPTTERER